MAQRVWDGCEAAEVAVASLFQALSRWRCQKRTNSSLRSAPGMSAAVSVKETVANTYEVCYAGQSLNTGARGRRRSKTALFLFVLQPILTLRSPS